MRHSTTSRRPPKPVLVFAAQAIVLTFAIGYWPTPREYTPALFQAGSEAVLNAAGANVRLGGVEGGQIEIDTVMKGYHADGTGPVWESQFSAVRVGWWPLAGFLALLLATPMTPYQRLAASAGGFGLLGLVALGRLGVEIAYAWAELERGPGGPAGGLGHLLLRVGSESLTATIPSAAAVFVVWVVVGRPWAALDLSSLRSLLGLPSGAQRTGDDSSQTRDPS